MISPQKPEKEKKQPSTAKEEFKGSFNLKKRINNMHTFFYSNISKFAGNLEGN